MSCFFLGNSCEQKCSFLEIGSHLILDIHPFATNMSLLKQRDINTMFPFFFIKTLLQMKLVKLKLHVRYSFYSYSSDRIVVNCQRCLHIFGKVFLKFLLQQSIHVLFRLQNNFKWSRFNERILNNRNANIYVSNIYWQQL